MADHSTEAIDLDPVQPRRSAPRRPMGVRAGFTHYLRPHAPTIGVATVMAAGGAALNLVGPSTLADITDLVTEGLATSIDLEAIGSLAALLAALYTAGFLLSFAQGYLMAGVVQSSTRAMRNDIARKINRLPLSYLDTRSTGDVLSRVTNDVDTVAQSMNQSLTSLVSSLTLLLGSAAMMLWTNWIMGLSGIVTVLAGAAVMSALMRRSQRYYSEQQVRLGALNGHIEETYGGFTVVKAFGGERRAADLLREHNEALYSVAWRSQFLSGLMMPIMIFIGNLAYVVVCIVGAVLALRGTISFGVIVAFMIYVRLFTQPLQALAQTAATLQPMIAGARRVFSLLSEREMGPDGELVPDPAQACGEIVVSHLRFGYNPERTILTDFSARVAPGQKVAIVGPTGAGKTTIVNLLMRFYEADHGTITIDGTSVRRMSRAGLRELFAMVLQDTWTFQGTLRDNLVYNRQGVSQERLDEVCAATGLTDLVRRLPQGYDTVLDEATSLSAGQKQLITIARAMIKDAPLLILDEATSSVDTRTEAVVQEAMDRLMSGRTSFVIAHRLSTIRNSDLILVLEGGDVVESGTHDELIALGGAYAELYNSQFEPAA
ncbi:MAG: ABC transporter ATP-binding protein [Actinomyces sp.]|uniref:ABC transporter ATP-binding protein n=1 Tax=Actinomyces sp. TaxID=29317 RepID=UPI0026DD116C|nr:ABC transporter ATP-binding protein [Actinomyces sp.]MDO4243025.1 ABC transporter ATP-binding protein [Actinomyces sp.]